MQPETNRLVRVTLTSSLKATSEFFIFSTDVFSTMFSGDSIESAPSARKMLEFPRYQVRDQPFRQGSYLLTESNDTDMARILFTPGKNVDII